MTTLDKENIRCKKYIIDVFLDVAFGEENHPPLRSFHPTSAQIT